MEQMIPYIKEEIKKGTRLNQIMRHTIGLFHSQKGSGYWKRYLSENMCIREADLQKVNHIMDHIKKDNIVTSLGE
jgi:tRNA-dihydrouridine synthase A